MATKEQKRLRMKMRQEKSFGSGDAKPKHNAGVVNNNTSTVRRTRTKKGKIKIKVSAAAGRRSAEFFKMQPGEKLFTRLDAEGKRMGGMGYRERIEEYKRELGIKEEKPEEYEKRLYISPTEKKPRFSKEPPFRKKKLYGRWSKNPKYGRMEVEDTTEKPVEWTITRIVPLIEK